jgi:DNA repair exonuclease SbcCD ATPase subunit
MKIKEFSIMRYGPLPNTGRISLHNFNLFFGRNEDGKTLTIDALVKLLLQRNIKDFERIDRVEESPEGYVIVEDDKGKEVKLPEKGNLTRVVDLTPSECRNIFIIRNSDLSIAREGEFYTTVTDRLTGLRTEELSKIKEILRENGKITPSGMFRDIKDEKLKTRIEEAENLIEEIDTRFEETERENFDELEEEYVRYREEINGVRQQIESLEDARKREKYEKGKEALNKFKDALEKFKDLEIYNEDDEQLCRDCERDIQTYNGEKEKLLTELKRNEKEFKEISEKLSKKEVVFQVLDERKKKLDDEVKPELRNYERKRGGLALQEGKSKFFTSVGIISAVLLGLSLLGVLVSPSLLFYILGVLFSISTVISGIFKFQFVRDKAWLAEVFERIKLTTSKFELGAENIEGILSNIQKFDEEYRKNADEIQAIKRRKEKLEDKIKELQGKTIPSKEKKIEDAQEKINEIRRKSGEESFQEYTQKLKLKQGYEKSIGEQGGILRNIFEGKSKALEDNISFWNEEIGNLEKYTDKAKNIKYNENITSELKDKEQSLKGELGKIEDTMSSFKKKMEDVERSANEISRLEEYLYCKTSVDLVAIKDKLEGFINENESNKDSVLGVMEIFEEIEKEEKEKVSELFDKDSSISRYFNEITSGLYEDVSFNQKIGGIEVKRKDGAILEAEKLSGGAYDQLYLSIRLALGEKLLKGKKGFFIMDDPFVKADPDRLQRQIEMLKRISEWGWQVIYFSAKGEIKDVLKKNIDNGAINYVEVQGVFS